MLEMADDVVIEEQSNTKLDDEKRWCVYMHTSPSEKKYIGITGESNPAYRWGPNGNGYLKRKSDGEFQQPAMAAAILKYPNWDDWKHEILLSGLTQQESEENEIELIDRYDTRNPMYGYNIRAGGNVLAGKNNPNYGNHKLAGENNPCYGKHYRCVPIYSIELHQIFFGSREAERKTGADHSAIIKCCKHKNQHTCCSTQIVNSPLHWLYVYDQKQKDGTIINGAITLGYITQEEVDNYLNNLKKGD